MLRDPALFPVVFDGMTHADPLVRMRCADAVEKITAVQPELLSPFRKRIIRLASVAGQQEVRWHLAQMVGRLAMTPAERRQMIGILTTYLDDPSRIVKTFAMQAMADIAAQDAFLRPPIVRRLERLTREGSPAMQSRGRHLLARLRAQSVQDRRGGKSSSRA